MDQVKRYIATQQEHHRKVSFQKEFLAFLRKHGLEPDARDLWGKSFRPFRGSTTLWHFSQGFAPWANFSRPYGLQGTDELYTVGKM
jgi:hypothetical protein